MRVALKRGVQNFVGDGVVGILLILLLRLLLVVVLLLLLLVLK